MTNIKNLSQILTTEAQKALEIINRLDTETLIILENMIKHILDKRRNQGK